MTFKRSIAAISILSAVLLAQLIPTREPVDKGSQYGPLLCDGARPDQALDAARRLELQRRAAAALDCVELELRARPESEAAWLKKAQLLARLGAVDDLRDALTAGIRTCRDCTSLRQYYARLLSAQGRWSAALRQWRFVAARGGSEYADRGLAVSRAMLGDTRMLGEWIDQRRRADRPVPVQYRALVKGQPLARATVVPETRVQFELTRVDRAPARAPVAEPSIVTAGDGRRVLVSWIDGRDGDEVFTKWRIWGALSDDYGTTWREFPMPAHRAGAFEFDPMTAYDPHSGLIVAGAVNLLSFGTVGTDNLIYHYLLGAEDLLPAGPVLSAPMESGRYDKGWMAFGPPVDGSPFGELFVTIAGDEERVPRIQSSIDGGMTWSELRALPLVFSSGVQPRVHESTLYVSAWVAFDALLLRSEDRGSSFDQFPIATYVADPEFGAGIPGDFRTAFFNQIAIDPVNGDIYSVWNDATMQSPQTLDYRIFLSRSTDRGETWTEPLIVSGADAGDQFMPWIEVDRDGRIHLLYADTRNLSQADDAEHATVDFYYASSADAGHTWAELRVTPESFSSAEGDWIGQSQFFGDYIGLATGDHDLYLAFPYVHGEGGLGQFVARRRLALDVSGLWFDPDQSGHGFSVQHIEIGGAEQILLAWFTYDGGQPIWVLAQGRLAGARAELTAYVDVSDQALFPPLFEPEQADLVEWGTITIDFDNPDSARVSWQDRVGAFGTDELNVRRLTRITSRPSGCFSGAWYDPAGPGHGLFIEAVEIDGAENLVVTWYAHHEGRQTWLQGIGPLVNGVAELTMLTFAGGTRPQDWDPAALTSEIWGGVEIRFVDPDTATISWSPELAGFPAGGIQLSRLTAIRGRSCGASPISGTGTG